MESLRVSSLLAFVLALWIANLFPVQRGVLVCESRAELSAERAERLAALSRETSIASSHIAWISMGSDAQASGAIDRVVLRVGLKHRISMQDLERELDRLTQSESIPVPQESSTDRRVSSERWRLQVAEHALARFRADCEKRGVALPENGSKPSFQLASHGGNAASSEDRAMQESLQEAVVRAEEGLANAEAEAHESTAESQGLFALAGKPRVVVQASGSSLGQASLLSLATLGVIIAGWRWVLRRRSRSRGRSAIQPSSESTEPGVLRREWSGLLRSCRIPYLGVLALHGIRVSRHAAAPAVAEARPRRVRQHFSQRLALLSRWSDRILALWVACFVLRYVLDPLWRELLFHAPLAAFSCVVGGV